MAEARRFELDGGLVAEVRFTDATDGDFRVRDPHPDLAAARAAIVDRPWSWIRQVHEATVLDVEHPGHRAGDEADGLLTTVVGCPIAVTTADCAPVVLVAERGVAVIHAGWRGLEAGIVEDAGRRLTESAGRPVEAVVGPSIGPEAYEFGRAELDRMIARFGRQVESRTETGTAALDVPAAVAAACRTAGWPEPARPDCTSDPRWFSHRARGDLGRQTAVVWLRQGVDSAVDR